MDIKLDVTNDRPLVLLLQQDGSKIFTASCDKSAKMWDLASNQFVQVAQVHVTSLLPCVVCCVLAFILQFLVVQNWLT